VPPYQPQQPPLLAPSPLSPDPEVHIRSARWHNGFYLRMGVGVAALDGSASHPNLQMDFAAIGGAFDLAIGGTPVRGLVIGGGVFFAFGSPTVKGTGLDGDKAGSLGVGVIGPMLDFYPMPKQGLHFQGAAGVGTLSWSKGPTSSTSPQLPPVEYTGAGAGFMIGAGYESFITDEWSLGGVAQVIYASADLDASDKQPNHPTLSTSAWCPGLVLVATYH
jgi:hypothetical protein